VSDTEEEVEHRWKAPPSSGGYARGCRCEGCTVKKREYIADLRTRQKGVCRVDMCNSPIEAKGMCGRCHRRWLSEGRPPLRMYEKWSSPAPHDQHPTYEGQ
jgi:hypothetical protein